jgi:hypothetical protein
MLQPTVLGRRGGRDCAQVLREQVRHGWRGVEARKIPRAGAEFAQKSNVKDPKPCAGQQRPLLVATEPAVKLWTDPRARILFLDR